MNVEGPHRNVDGETFGLREVYTVLVLGISGTGRKSCSRGIRSEVWGSGLHLGGSSSCSHTHKVQLMLNFTTLHSRELLRCD